ncbi:MAG: hypothetical protein AABY15_06580 [Nanoarchaeota archaeon]
MDKQLLKNLVNAQYKRSPELDHTACPGEKVKMFTVDGETSTCKMWNSSNDSTFSKVDACREIANKILDEDVCEGNFSLDFNEIWFEITEK